MALSLTEINAFTHQEIVPKTTDVIFKQSPLFVRLLDRQQIKFEGGTQIQRPIMFAELNGDFFGKGETFDVAYVQTDTAFVANMKFAYVNVTLYGTDDVLNRGRNSAFSQVETKFTNASLKMAKMLAQSLYKDGQSSATDVTTSGGILSTSKAFDGLLAWIDDGNNGSGSYTTATDATKSFTSIGGIARSDLFTTAPVFGTGTSTPAGGVAGANSFTERAFTDFQLKTVNNAYGNAWWGNEFPDLMLCQQNGWNRMWNSLQPNQRYMAADVDVAKVGFKSFRFNASEVTVDRYMPDQVMLGLNTNYLEMYMSAAPKFQFGFTGFKEAQNSIDFSGQFLYSGNLMVPNPRTCFKLIGSALS